MLVASTLLQEVMGFPIDCTSRLDINRIIPSESIVFHLVREGRLQELREMLQRGEASLRDHDEYGASLLFVSNSASTLRLTVDMESTKLTALYEVLYSSAGDVQVSTRKWIKCRSCGS